MNLPTLQWLQSEKNNEEWHAVLSSPWLLRVRKLDWDGWYYTLSLDGLELNRPLLGSVWSPLSTVEEAKSAAQQAFKHWWMVCSKAVVAGVTTNIKLESGTGSAVDGTSGEGGPLRGWVDE